MQRWLCVGLVCTLCAGGVFAGGDQETPPPPADFRGPDQGWVGPVEKVTLTGTVTLDQEKSFPVLVSEGKEYALIYPPMADGDFDIGEGEEISVEGYLSPGPLKEAIWEEGTLSWERYYLRVSKATIGGTVYIIVHAVGPQLRDNPPDAQGDGMPLNTPQAPQGRRQRR